jgi:Rac GTPase-activating protein 1
MKCNPNCSLQESLIRDKWHPHIGDLDVHVIASTLKIFLHELKEPIIPASLRELFLAVVPLTDERDVQSVVYSLVPQLPQPNRDTLAFLILHLQR